MYADILLPLNIENTLTYHVPEGMRGDIAVGKRVVVELRRGVYTGLIVDTNVKKPDTYIPKDIIEILDREPCVSRNCLKLWNWVGRYYCCTSGEVMRAALPSAMKIESTTKLELNGDFKDESILTDEQFLIYEALGNNSELSIDDVAQILDRKNVIPIIKDMIDKGAVSIFKEYNERYRPKSESYLYLHPSFEIEEAMKLTKRSSRQREALLAFLSLNNDGRVKRKDLTGLHGITYATIDALVKKEILELKIENIDRLNAEGQTSEIKTLSMAQQKALEEIERGFDEEKTVLLHGVTGSGKTEIYIDLISRTIEKGGQCLYLLPEIALTTQLIERLKKHFGSRVGVYHSKYNDMERAEVWLRTMSQKENRFDVIIGARSAVFLPFNDLRLVIIDEEHDPSFKQMDPAPRYNGRDTALVLAHMCGAKVLMGSATPAIESYHNTTSGKYHLVELKERYQGVIMPSITLVNIREAYSTASMKGHFSTTLIEGIKDALSSSRQVILFQNRRGHSPIVECLQCGWVAQCSHCDVSLTYHSHSDSMKCHYCGYEQSRPRTCPVCGGMHLDTKGLGTQQVEEEARRLFPDARILRMDSDTTTGKDSHLRIITAFEKGEADILIGTQMVSKGLDFDRVALVGILNADNTFKSSDFRSYERGFQMLCQISGRAGRKDAGRVILQTYDPTHPVIRNITRTDYINMYHEIMRERKEFYYPPYCRMIRVVLRHKDPYTLDVASRTFASWLSQLYRGTIIGPEDNPIPRINNLYIKQLYIKIPMGENPSGVKDIIRRVSSAITREKTFRTVRITIDVDPV